MATSVIYTDLFAAPDSKAHFVQFFEDDQFLCDRAARFLEFGLRRGESVVIIATTEHRRAFEARLVRAGVEVETLMKRGQIHSYDARQMLGRFMVNGLPDEESLRRVLGGIVSRIRGRTQMRACTDMVNLMAREGNFEAAVRIEKLWKEQIALHAFPLFCGYDLGSFDSSAAKDRLLELCGAHTHVFPGERYLRLHTDEERLRFVVDLQYRARALEDEIARRKKMEVTLRERERELQETLDAREEFLSIASHELRTPLTSLQLELQILRRALQKNEFDRADRTAQDCDLRVRRLSGLVGQLLDISRLRHGALPLRRERVDLVRLTREVLRGLEYEILESGSSVAVHADEPVVGMWDVVRLEQVIVNLAMNAIKYGEGKPVEIRVTSENGHGLLVVQDQGIGMTAEEQQRVFGRFERAGSPNAIPGLGLGLYIAKEIVEAHQGGIRVTSAPGHGSTFTVELPVSEREGKESQKHETTADRR